MAQPKFEDLVTALQSADSIFSLSDDLPLLAAGLLDLQNRLHVVEAAVKAHPAATPAQKA